MLLAGKIIVPTNSFLSRGPRLPWRHGWPDLGSSDKPTTSVSNQASVLPCFLAQCESQPSLTKVKKRTSLGCNAGCPQVSVLQCSVGHLWICLRRTQSLWLQRVPWGQLLTSGAVAASEVQEVVMRLWPAGESPWVQPQTLSSQVSGDRDLQMG